MILGWNLQEVINIIKNCFVLGIIGGLACILIWLIFDKENNRVHTSS